MTSNPDLHGSLQRLYCDSTSSPPSTIRQFRLHIPPLNVSLPMPLLQLRPSVGVFPDVLVFTSAPRSMPTILGFPLHTFDPPGILPLPKRISAYYRKPLMQSAYCHTSGPFASRQQTDLCLSRRRVDISALASGHRSLPVCSQTVQHPISTSVAISNTPCPGRVEAQPF